MFDEILRDFDEINAILNSMTDERIVEPIDDPNIQTDFWDWAEVVGAVDDFVPEEYNA
jgi:hypothetical protein